MMKKATVKNGSRGKEKRAYLWAVPLFASILAVGLVLLSMVTPGAVAAKTFTVTSTLDETDTAPGDGACVTASGQCTLRAAIQETNAIPGPDVIKLRPGIYVLTISGTGEDLAATGDLDITDDLAIIGTGAKNTFINGGKLDRVFNIIGLSQSVITIADLTIQNGLVTDRGGGMLIASGEVTLKGCTISNNTTSGGGHPHGGGIYNAGFLTITKSTLSGSIISRNFISGGDDPYGGGIYNLTALTITGSTISNNSIHSTSTGSIGAGGGIFNEGTLTITGSTVSNNSVSSAVAASSYGGAIYNKWAPLTIKHSTISNNTALGGNDASGGAIFTDLGWLTITGGTVSNNAARGDLNGRGGGICGYNGEVTVKGSTISHNAASGKSSLGTGGGIYIEDGELSVLNASKIVRNFASDEGGGIFLAGLGTGNISTDSTVAKNIPDNISPDSIAGHRMGVTTD